MLPDEPTIEVPLAEWKTAMAQIDHIHTMMCEIEKSVKPAMDQMMSGGGLFSMLLGRKK